MSKRIIISNRYASHADSEKNPSGWHTRGYLPHFDGEECTQFITYRLANSLPRDYVDGLKRKLRAGHISEVEYQRSIETYLDDGHGPTHCAIEPSRRSLKKIC